DGADFNGVALSADGIRWYEVQSLRSLTTTYREFVVDLDKAIANLGLAYNSTFRLRFNRYDDYPIPFDGIAFDDVSISGTATFRFLLSAPARMLEGTGSYQGQIQLPQPAG